MPVRPPEARVIVPAVDWVAAKEYGDILYEKYEGIAKITINRPEVRNAFRPLTTRELIRAFEIEKECYEFIYASTYLPSWLWAPTEGLKGLLDPAPRSR